jgi:uncharacterized protein (TIGR03435 family)
MRLMMQALLAEQFHLVIHYMTADAPVFALSVVKPGVTGPKLQSHPASDGCAAPMSDPVSLQGSVGELPPVCGIIAHVFAPASGLAVVSRPVIDQTGLSGLYDFTLTWVHDMTGGDAAIPDNAGAFRGALKAQLGLELKQTHAPVSFLMVDHVERPSDN